MRAFGCPCEAGNRFPRILSASIQYLLRVDLAIGQRATYLVDSALRQLRAVSDSKLTQRPAFSESQQLLIAYVRAIEEAEVRKPTQSRNTLQHAAVGIQAPQDQFLQAATTTKGTSDSLVRHVKQLRLRAVLTWIDAVQFGMASQVLEEAGIPFDVDGRTINSVEDPACAFPINHLSMRVREEGFDRAHDLLEETVGRGVVAGG